MWKKVHKAVVKQWSDIYRLGILERDNKYEMDLILSNNTWILVDKLSNQRQLSASGRYKGNTILWFIIKFQG